MGKNLLYLGQLFNLAVTGVKSCEEWKLGKLGVRSKAQ